MSAVDSSRVSRARVVQSPAAAAVVKYFSRGSEGGGITLIELPGVYTLPLFALLWYLNYTAVCWYHARPARPARPAPVLLSSLFICSTAYLTPFIPFKIPLNPS